MRTIEEFVKELDELGFVEVANQAMLVYEKDIIIMSYRKRMLSSGSAEASFYRSGKGSYLFDFVYRPGAGFERWNASTYTFKQLDCPVDIPIASLILLYGTNQ